jgi:hypothetical protein
MLALQRKRLLCPSHFFDVGFRKMGTNNLLSDAAGLTKTYSATLPGEGNAFTNAPCWLLILKHRSILSFNGLAFAILA